MLFILLSIAQRQYHHKYTRHNTTYQVCLFVTNPKSLRDTILFDADIPTALLDELDDPRIVPQPRTRLVIHRTKMSIEPRKDFLARPVAALLNGGDGNAADGEGRGEAKDERLDSTFQTRLEC